LIQDRQLESGEITSRRKALTCELIIHSCLVYSRGCNGTQASNKHDRDDGLKIRRPLTSTDISVWLPKEEADEGRGRWW
jgi:hypothetical protein